MATRTARTAWNGSLAEGSGQVELTSSGVGTYQVSWPRRAEDAANGVTSPEELIAAAHSACFAMPFSAMLGEEGGTVHALDVSALVGFGPDPAGVRGVRRTARWGKVSPAGARGTGPWSAPGAVWRMPLSADERRHLDP